LKFPEDCWSSPGGLKRFPKLEKSIFHYFSALKKIEKIDPGPYPRPILAASQGVGDFKMRKVMDFGEKLKFGFFDYFSRNLLHNNIRKNTARARCGVRFGVNYIFDCRVGLNRVFTYVILSSGPTILLRNVNP